MKRLIAVLVVLLFAASMAHGMVQSGQLSAHFSRSEFACHHCGKIIPISTKLIRKLEELRGIAGDRPVTIVSGYRCPYHNQEVGGASDSRHLYGKAADIKIAGLNKDETYELVQQVGFTCMIKYPKSTHIHVDVR